MGLKENRRDDRGKKDKKGRIKQTGGRMSLRQIGIYIKKARGDKN